MELSASSKSDTRIKLQSAENGLNHNSVSNVNKDYLKDADRKNSNIQEPKGLGEDRKKVILLTYLYFLQGIPLGI